MEVAADVDLEAALVEPELRDGLVAAEVGQADAGADRGGPRGAGDLADRVSPPPDRLASPQHLVRVVEDQGDQPSPGPGPRSDRRCPASASRPRKSLAPSSAVANTRPASTGVTSGVSSRPKARYPFSSRSASIAW